MEYPYQTARQAIKRWLQAHKPNRVALELDVDDAHIYRARRGDITLTLKRALRKRGDIPPPKVRHRRAAEFTAHRARQFDAMLGDRGLTLTDWMNEELDKWLK